MHGHLCFSSCTQEMQQMHISLEDAKKSRCRFARRCHVHRCPPSTIRWTLCTRRGCSSRCRRLREWYRVGSRIFCIEKEPTVSYTKSLPRGGGQGKTHPPLKAPTGLRSGRAADGVSRSCDEVLKVRASCIGRVAGRQHARRAVGSKVEAIVMLRCVSC